MSLAPTSYLERLPVWIKRGSVSGSHLLNRASITSDFGHKMNTGSSFASMEDGRTEFSMEIEKLSRGGRRVIQVRLLDPQDATFFLVSDLDEAQFSHLQQDQNILVGFDAFPSKLIDFIHLIQENAKDPSPR